jgi:hypothetical protein
MIRTKLYTSHPHHWVPMVFSLSCLIHYADAGIMPTAASKPAPAAMFAAMGSA